MLNTNFRLISTLLFLFLLALIVPGCSKQQEPVETENTAQQRIVIQEIWDSHIIVTKAGDKQAILRYGHMVKYEGESQSYFDQGVQVDFFDNNGQHSSRLTADAGEYEEETEEVIGRGNVLVVSDSGFVMKTERIEYDAALEKIFSDTLVMMITPDSDTLWSIGFESNADLTHRIFFKPRIHFNRHIDITNLNENAKSENVVKNDTTGIQ
ncbi:LPS export ABC transporter periplasmic protein LptC [bacterium]|nr:LPS export ABC transporter periplasmic protein LptC [bacterium]